MYTSKPKRQDPPHQTNDTNPPNHDWSIIQCLSSNRIQLWKEQHHDQEADIETRHDSAGNGKAAEIPSCRLEGVATDSVAGLRWERDRTRLWRW